VAGILGFYARDASILHSEGTDRRHMHKGLCLLERSRDNRNFFDIVQATVEATVEATVSRDSSDKPNTPHIRQQP
jgi:hypothetical protein